MVATSGALEAEGQEKTFQEMEEDLKGKCSPVEDHNHHDNQSQQQPNSLGDSDTSSSGHSSLPSSPGSEQLDESSSAQPTYKCSAVHTLERDMPDFDYSHLVRELRQLILEDIEKNGQGLYSPSDIDKCRQDDWYLSRFLLRNKLQLEEAYDMLRKAMRFNHESLASQLKAEDFPAEFYQLGGIFSYEPDRKGNKMLYLRVSLHRKTPEIQAIVQAFIYQHIRRLDEEAKGKGISIVIDCTGGGLAGADMDTLLFIITTLKNYFPKGLSYFLIHEMPWILKPFWHIAKAWIPEEHKQLIKFSDSRTVFEYVDIENLPDYMGGTCKRPYSVVPENCTRMEEAGKLWGIDHRTMRRVLEKFQENLPEETVDRIYKYFDECDRREAEERAAAAALT